MNPPAPLLTDIKPEPGTNAPPEKPQVEPQVVDEKATPVDAPSVKDDGRGTKRPLDMDAIFPRSNKRSKKDE
jgi:hypothetical protein